MSGLILQNIHGLWEISDISRDDGLGENTLSYCVWFDFIMAKIGIGRVMNQLKAQIKQIESELEELGEPENIPEMIETTNILRANEHLSKTNKKKSELLAAYALYTEQLEDLLSSVFEIQNDLREILKDQSKLIRQKPKKSRKKTRQ